MLHIDLSRPGVQPATIANANHIHMKPLTVHIYAALVGGPWRLLSFQLHYPRFS